MFHAIDSFLNRLTMYRVVLNGLLTLAVVALGLAFLHVLPFSGFAMLASLVLLLLICEGSNRILAKVFRAAPSMESSVITALILFFVLSPPSSREDVLFLVLAGVLAMASKYVIAFHKKHLFNPAAFGAVVIGVLGSGLSIWWIGSPVLLPLTAVIGLLIVRKLRRERLFLSFMAVSIITIVIIGLNNGNTFATLLPQIFLSWPLVFFATIMLTEPSTTPPTKHLQMIYGAIVGMLFGLQFHVGPLYSTPELALLLGNLFAYAVSSRQKLALELIEKRELAREVMEFSFKPNEKLVFQPGQYVEWTLPHAHPDDRGNRRYFTVASSPTESEFKLGVRVHPNNPSTFKKALMALPEGGVLMAGQLAGDFTLPEDQTRPLVFIAGGIGVTPFRSMIQYLMDLGQKRTVTLFYAAPEPANFAYGDIFAKAHTKIGLKTVYLVSNAASIHELAPTLNGKAGYLTAEILQAEVPSYRDCLFYLSGPSMMVDTYKKLLDSLQIESKNIKTDYFPGF